MPPPHESPAKQTGRVEAFSDGVFAIAMTLLALDLKVPHLAGPLTSRALLDALAAQWPSYFAFTTSFFTVLIMWVNHHAMFRLIHRVNTRLLFANGFLLLITTAVPFPTALVAEYLRTPAARAACAVYGATFFVGSISFNLLWYTVAKRGGLLHSEAPPAMVARITKNYRVGPLLYLIATVSAFFSVALCMAIISALWIFWSATARDPSSNT